MTGIPRKVTEHCLDILPESKPVKQRLRHFDNDKRTAIGEEIARLLVAGFIKGFFYPKWITNPVLVLKKNGTWIMCVDYTSLNKACPKVPYSLP